MMENRPFRRVVTAGYADSFNGRSVQPSALMAFLEETAAEHCRVIGRDIFSLLEAGQGWVLTGGGLKVFRYPDYGEELIVETWISSWKMFSGIREYRVSSPAGEILAEAGGRWVYWDIGIRKPIAIPEIFRESWYLNDDSPYRVMYPHSETPAIPEPDPGAADESSINLTVRRGDVDLYGHLHNTTYMDWLMEAVPDHLYRDSEPTTLGIRFFGEARLGDDVIFTTRIGRWGRLHEVRRSEDGILLARGFSEWIERRKELSA
jgi:medium-chain acyl-[acyl-carrier-protein] hydrolase